MLVKRALLGLPTSLLVLALAQQAQADAHDVDEQQQQQQQRNGEGRAQQAQPQIIPLAIRKMSLDEGEKFYPENYYGFELDDDDTSGSGRRRSARASDKIDSFGRSLGSLFSFGRRAPSISMASSIRSEKRTEEKEETHTNSSVSTDDVFLPQAYLPPFSIHQGHEHEVAEKRQHEDDGAAGIAHELYRRASEALAHLQRRQWSCPSGTASCSDIGYPYSCCSTGETCYAITDTGLGPVGCCPSGSTCGGAVTSCSPSSTACPSSLGGGCCIEGYECAGIGCIKVGSSSTTTIARTSTASSTSTTSASTSTTTTSSTSSTSTSSTTITGSSGVAPIKPTRTGTDSSLPSGYCPTGYYGCLAVAGGGCCQTGRDCQTTSCAPAAASTTIVNTNGITVVVPESAAAAAATASSTCATGWFMCGASAGPVAGCCPSGYGCGTASCTMTSASSTAEVQKELPTKSSSGQRLAVSMGLVLSLALAVVM
ncbi:gpi anchored protein [Ophiostoma piceae UAMH 11346]|uniref:Gpi anchored protein n=1 Tax=Ophiostoma piceae (strain UAMH 11346) TaxID=1262450 RepID=S3BWS3_OPHP1|nr:gpi anchored protein [Ophiostoma piceae UAMH 11346]